MSAPLTWDNTGKRFFEMGVDHGVLYVQNSDGSYGKGVAWNGLTGITESPDGAEPTDLWADNLKYATLRSAETFGGTIEAYTYPDEFMECDGSAVPAPGIRLGQQNRKAFGLCYRTKIGNDTDPSGNDYLLHIVYGATASPSEKSYETINDSPDAITFSWEFTTNPVEVSGYKSVSTIVIDSRKIDATALATIENVLYGSVSADAALPDPATIIGYAGVTTTYAFTAVSNATTGYANMNPAVSGWYEATVAEPTLTDPGDFRLTSDTSPVNAKTYYTRIASAAATT